MNEHAQTAIKALDRMKGDNTARALAAFRGMTAKQLDEQHGQSGETRRQVLEAYQAHDRKVDAAIAWVKSAAAMKP